MLDYDDAESRPSVIEGILDTVDAVREAVDALMVLADEMRAALDLYQGDPKAQLEYLRGVFWLWQHTVEQDSEGRGK